MANIISYPDPNLANAQNWINVPVNYSTSNGLARMLSAIGSSTKTPYVRNISVAEFLSGNYSFPLPDGYQAAPYKFPMIEPNSILANSDTIIAYKTVDLYVVGSNSSRLPLGTYPLLINNNVVTAGGITFPTIQTGVEFVIIMNVTQGSSIDWAKSNVAFKVGTDNYLRNENQWIFRIVNDATGTLVVEELNWNLFFSTNLNLLKTSNKTYLYSILNEIYDLAYAGGAGAAGGDLTGTYPNPTINAGKVTTPKIANGAVTADKMAANSVGESNIVNGAVTTGKIGLSAVTADKMAANSVGESNIVNGAVTTGKIGLSAVTADKIAANSVGTVQVSNGAITTPKIANNAIAYDLLDQLVQKAVDRYHVCGIITFAVNAQPRIEVGSDPMFKTMISSVRQDIKAGGNVVGVSLVMTIGDQYVGYIASASITAELVPLRTLTLPMKEVGITSCGISLPNNKIVVCMYIPDDTMIYGVSVNFMVSTIIK